MTKSFRHLHVQIVSCYVIIGISFNARYPNELKLLLLIYSLIIPDYLEMTPCDHLQKLG